MTASGLAEESKYPMPDSFATSVIVGRKLKNPFAAKLRQSQNMVKNIVRDDSEKLKDSLQERLSIGTTMYFGASSNRNRAIINGKVRRPGDKIQSIGHRSGPISVRILEIRQAGVVLQVSGPSSHQPILLPTEKKPRRSVENAS